MDQTSLRSLLQSLVLYRLLCRNEELAVLVCVAGPGILESHTVKT